MGKQLKKVAQSPIGKIGIPLAAGFALGPAGAGLTSALGGASLGAGASTLAGGGSIKDALISGGLSYAGGTIGGKLFPETFGSALGSTAKNAVGPEFLDMGLGDTLGQSASNAIGANIANTSIGSALGSYAGNAYAGDLMGPVSSGDSGDTGAQADPFSPQKAQLDLPGSLSGFSSLDQNQQASNLATQGVYGGGLGPQEQSYFKGLLNNQLVDDSGNVGDMSSLSPIEQSYLSQLGLGGFGNSKSLLEALSRRT